MGNWIRLYNSILDDPALATVPDDALRTWLLIQAVAGRADGDIPGSCSGLPHLKDLAWTLRMPGKEKRLARHLHILLTAGLLERSGEAILPRDWSLQQKASDNPTKRKREQRQREQEKPVPSHVTDDRLDDDKSQVYTEICHVTGHDPLTCH